jgi:hypothetical protein
VYIRRPRYMSAWVALRSIRYCFTNSTCRSSPKSRGSAASIASMVRPLIPFWVVPFLPGDVGETDRLPPRPGLGLLHPELVHADKRIRILALEQVPC